MTEPRLLKYSEARLAEKIGIPRAELREQRKLHFEEGLDYKKIGGEMLLSERAVIGLAKLCNTHLPDLDLTECLASAGKKNGAIKMKVVMIPINPRMVIAEREDGQRELVFVGKNATFAPFDEIEVVKHDTQGGIWQIVSPIPRDKRRTFPQ